MPRLGNWLSHLIRRVPPTCLSLFFRMSDPGSAPIYLHDSLRNHLNAGEQLPPEGLYDRVNRVAQVLKEDMLFADHWGCLEFERFLNV